MDPIRRILSKRVAVITALLIIGAMPGATTAGSVYKWVDDNGKINYGDRIPPQYIKHGHQELSEQGVAIRSIDRAKTKEQIEDEQRRKAEQEQLRAERLRNEQKQKDYDRLLLSTYLVEEDMIRVRDSKIATLEGTINLTERNIRNIKQTLEMLKQEAAEQQQDADLVKEALEKVASTESQLKEYEAYVQRKRDEQKNIRAQFDLDLARFRELKAAKQ